MTPRLFLERTLARMPPTLGGVYSAAMILCDELPARCEKQSPEDTLSVALVFYYRVRSYYAARQVVAMFTRRFDSRPIAERLSACLVPILHKRSAANAAQSSTDASSSQAPNPLQCRNPSCQARAPASVHSSRSPNRTPRLQAQLLSCSVRRSPAVHLSRSSRRREPTRRLSRRSRTAQPLRTSLRSPRSTLQLRRRQLQSRPRLSLQLQVRSRC